MPASSHGFPTSAIRLTGSPHREQRILTLSTYGPMRGVALELVPALDGPLGQLLPPTDDVDRGRTTRQSYIGSARPQ